MKIFRLFFLIIYYFTSKSWSLKPDEFSKNCIDSLSQKNLIEWCRTGAMIDYDPIKLHTNVTTVWEACCETFDELDCYKSQGRRFCPPNIFEHLVEYIDQVDKSFRGTLCTNPGYNQWQIYCAQLKFNAIYHYDHQKYDLNLNVPTSRNNTVVKNCLESLTNHSTDGNRIMFCKNQTVQSLHTKYNDTIHAEINCCGEYNFIECIHQQADHYCHESRKQIDEWIRESLETFSNHYCHRIPYYNKHNKLNDKTIESCKHYGFELGNNGKHSSNKWWIVIPIAGLIIGGLILYYYYRK